MLNKEVLKQLVLINILFSIGYIFLVYILGGLMNLIAEGSKGQFLGQIIRTGYGSVVFVIRLRLMQVSIKPQNILVRFSKNDTLSKELILDEKIEEKRINKEHKRVEEINFTEYTHLLIALFLIVGEFILSFNYPVESYMITMATGVVYAGLLVIVGGKQLMRNWE